MDEQPKVSGYTTLTPEQVVLMNEIKALEEHCASVYRKLMSGPGLQYAAPREARWLSLGRTHLEAGFMFLVKAVAKPTNGLGNA